MATKSTGEKSVFETLYAINVNDKTEKKNGLTYLSWPFAWGEVKKAYPESTYRIYENPDGWNYFTDGRTCWVKTSVTICGIENIEYLPVMDYRNNSIPVDKVTSMDVNKAIQRSLTKCCARHGLGLYIYAGEDLPEGDKQPQQAQQANVAIDAATVRAWLTRVTTEVELNQCWKAVPQTLQAEVLPLFKAKKQALKGGKA
jgi:hypothetical protein